MSMREARRVETFSLDWLAASGKYYRRYTKCIIDIGIYCIRAKTNKINVQSLFFFPEIGCHVEGIHIYSSFCIVTLCHNECALTTHMFR